MAGRLIIATGMSTFTTYCMRLPQIESYRFGRPNLCSTLDARTALCFHADRHWPGARKFQQFGTHDAEQSTKLKSQGEAYDDSPR